MVAAGKLNMEYVRTAANTADIFTKPLPATRSRDLRKEIVVDLYSILQAGGMFSDFNYAGFLSLKKNSQTRTCSSENLLIVAFALYL